MSLPLITTRSPLATGLCIAIPFAIAIGAYATYYEIKTTPEGCRPVIFPEQSYRKQPARCQSERPSIYEFTFGKK